MTNEQLYSEFEEQAKKLEEQRVMLEKEIAARTLDLKGLELQSKAFRVAMETLAPGCVFAAPEVREDDYRPERPASHPNADRKKPRFGHYE